MEYKKVHALKGDYSRGIMKKSRARKQGDLGDVKRNLDSGNIPSEEIVEGPPNVIKEWSQEENPVQAVFYVTSASGKRVAPADSDFFRGQAIALRDRYLENTGRRLPVFSINLDNFYRADKPVVEYSVWANNPLSALYLRLKGWL